MIVRSSEMSTMFSFSKIKDNFGQHEHSIHGGLLQQAPYPPIIGPHRTSLPLIGRGARLWLGATNTSVSGLIEQNSRDSTPSARSKSLVDMSRPTLLRFQLWSLRYTAPVGQIHRRYQLRVYSWEKCQTRKSSTKYRKYNKKTISPLRRRIASLVTYLALMKGRQTYDIVLSESKINNNNIETLWDSLSLLLPFINK